MWMNRLLEELSLDLPADLQHRASEGKRNTQLNMDKSVFARVLKVIIQCVEEGSALLQTFKMEGDISNTRITIEFQSYELHPGITEQSGDSSRHNDDSSQREYKDSKDKHFHAFGQSSKDKLSPSNSSSSYKHGGTSGTTERSHENMNRDTTANVVMLRERYGQNLQQRLQQSLAEMEKNSPHDITKDYKEKKCKSRQKGVNLEQVIHDQNCIPPVTDNVSKSELCEAIKTLDYAKKKEKGRNPFIKSRSLDDLDSPGTNSQTNVSRAKELSMPNGTNQRQLPGDIRPKTVTFSSPQAMEQTPQSSQISGIYLKGTSYDTDDYQGTGSSHDETDSDESLESVTDIRKFNMNQRKKLLKKRKSVIAL